MLSCRNAIESSGSVKPSRARPDETAHGGEKLTDSMVRSSGSSPVSHVTELVVLERLTGYSKSARGSRASMVRATGSTCGSPRQRVVPRTDTKLAEGRVRLRWRTATVLAGSYPPDYCVGFSRLRRRHVVARDRGCCWWFSSELHCTQLSVQMWRVPLSTRRH
jgi:hypothetical protein